MFTMNKNETIKYFCFIFSIFVFETSPYKKKQLFPHDDDDDDCIPRKLKSVFWLCTLSLQRQMISLSGLKPFKQIAIQHWYIKIYTSSGVAYVQPYWEGTDTNEGGALPVRSSGEWKAQEQDLWIGLWFIIVLSSSPLPFLFISLCLLFCFVIRLGGEGTPHLLGATPLQVYLPFNPASFLVHGQAKKHNQGLIRTAVVDER